MWTTEGPSVSKEAEGCLTLTSLWPEEPHGLTGQTSAWNTGWEALLEQKNTMISKREDLGRNSKGQEIPAGDGKAASTLPQLRGTWEVSEMVEPVTRGRGHS